MENDICNGESDKKNTPEQPSKLRKYMILFLGLFLILLMVSFTFATFPIADIIVGKSASHNLLENELNIGDIKVILSEQVRTQLQQKYLQEQGKEIVSCLQGTKESNNYIITSAYTPKIFQQTFNHVQFSPCSEDSIILLHSHPFQRCRASQTDIHTLQENQERNEDLAMLIMCDLNRFAFYR